jgi:hypothetical protein
VAARHGHSFDGLHQTRGDDKVPAGVLARCRLIAAVARVERPNKVASNAVSRRLHLELENVISSRARLIMNQNARSQK